MGTGTKRDWDRERERGWMSMNEHRMGTGTEAGTETKAVAEIGTGTRMGTGTRAGSGRVEERRRSARNRTRRVVDAMWETGETWVEIGKNVDNKGFVQQLPTQIV